MLGIEFARLYVSGSFDSTPPMAHAITARRRNPVILDSAVPALITAVARVSEDFSSGSVGRRISPVMGSDGGSGGGPEGGAAIAGMVSGVRAAFRTPRHGSARPRDGQEQRAAGSGHERDGADRARPDEDLPRPDGGLSVGRFDPHGQRERTRGLRLERELERPDRGTAILPRVSRSFASRPSGTSPSESRGGPSPGSEIRSR